MQLPNEQVMLIHTHDGAFSIDFLHSVVIVFFYCVFLTYSVEILKLQVSLYFRFKITFDGRNKRAVTQKHFKAFHFHTNKKNERM